MKLKRTAAPVRPKDFVGSTGMTELMYIGKSAGVITWWGAVTGHQYKAGLDRQRLLVDNRDVDAALAKWRERDVAVFVRAPARKPAKPANLPPTVEEAKNSEVEKVNPPDVGAVEAAEAQPARDGEPLEQIEQAQAEDESLSKAEWKATVSAQMLADANGLDLALLWTGKKITRQDVDNWLRDNPNWNTGNVPA